MQATYDLKKAEQNKKVMQRVARIGPDDVIRLGVVLKDVNPTRNPVGMGPSASAPPRPDSREFDRFISNWSEGESFRSYVVRRKIETFRAMMADLAKPSAAPEMYRDWGDEASSR